MCSAAHATAGEYKAAYALRHLSTLDILELDFAVSQTIELIRYFDEVE